LGVRRGQHGDAHPRGPRLRHRRHQGTRQGRLQVYVDGVPGSIVDLYSPSAVYRRIVWQASYTSPAQHAVTLRVLGDRGSASSATIVEIFLRSIGDSPTRTRLGDTVSVMVSAGDSPQRRPANDTDISRSESGASPKRTPVASPTVSHHPRHLSPSRDGHPLPWRCHHRYRIAVPPIHGTCPSPHRLRPVPGQSQRIHTQPGPLRVRSRLARRGRAHPCAPRPLRAAAVAAGAAPLASTPNASRRWSRTLARVRPRMERPGALPNGRPFAGGCCPRSILGAPCGPFDRWESISGKTHERLVVAHSSLGAPLNASGR